MIAPKAGVAVGGQVFLWMMVLFTELQVILKELPCTVLDHVFSDINKSQRFKIFAGHNQVHNEVIWFYPSASSQK